MLNVRMLREALADLPDYANIRLDFNTSSDTLAEVFDKLELIAARRCPHTGDLVIEIDDSGVEGKEGEYDDGSGVCRFCGRQLSSDEQADDRCEQCINDEEEETP
jgi:hypothetical protein